MIITDEAVEAAANSLSQSSGMRFDGFWSRVEDLEPEDREYALTEARAALEAAAPFLRAAVAAAKGDRQEKPRNSVPAPPVPGWGELKKGNDGK